MPTVDIKEALSAAEAAVKAQLSHFTKVGAEHDAATAVLEKAEAKLRRAMGSATASAAERRELQAAVTVAEQRAARTEGVFLSAQAELERLEEGRDSVRERTAAARYEQAKAELHAIIPAFHAETIAMIEAWYARYEEYDTLRDVVATTYKESEYLAGRTPRVHPPYRDEIAKRWPGFLGKLIVLAQLARGGHIPMPARGARSVENMSEVAKRLRPPPGEVANRLRRR